MPFIVVWTANIDVNEDNGVTTRVDSKRCGLHTDQILYAEEHTITSGEVYVTVNTLGFTIDIFEQTLDSLRELDKGAPQA